MGLTEAGRQNWLNVLSRHIGTEIPSLADRLAVEQYLSNFLGQMWWSSVIHADEGAVDAQLEMVMIEHLHRRGDDLAAAMLSAMTDLAATPGARRAAGKCLSRICSGNATIPPWHGKPIAVTECWQGGDVFGDQIGYALVCDGAAGSHAIAVNIDFCPHQTDLITALVIDKDIAAVRKSMHDHAQRVDYFFGPDPIEPVTVSAIIPPTLECVTAEVYGRDVDKVPHGLIALRSLLMSRLRLLPDTEPWIPDLADEAEMAHLLEDFLNDTDPLRALDKSATQTVWELINFHTFGGLRVSPMQSYMFLNAYLPAKFAGDSPAIAKVPELLPEFCDWAAARLGLSRAATTHLRETTAIELYGFPEWTKCDPSRRFHKRPLAR